jgi:hypothetical protein
MYVCSAKNSGKFEALCEEVGAEYSSLMFRREVHWLSRQNVFNTFTAMPSAGDLNALCQPFCSVCV